MDEWIKAARASWRWRGQDRPPFAVEPGADQESVWDYPRPPSVEPVAERVRVELGSIVLTESQHAVRVLETASAPAIYVPFGDVRMDLMEQETGGTVCEWKGPWVYWTIRSSERTVPQAAWSYTDPWSGYEEIREHLSFYPAKVDRCWLGDQRVEPQPGGFYGGWVTAEIVGPMKGGPGSQGW